MQLIQVTQAVLQKVCHTQDGAKMDLNLHPQQYKAFTSPATEILYGGAAGGGALPLLV